MEHDRHRERAIAARLFDVLQLQSEALAGAKLLGTGASDLGRESGSGVCEPGKVGRGGNLKELFALVNVRWGDADQAFQLKLGMFLRVFKQLCNTFRTIPSVPVEKLTIAGLPTQLLGPIK